MINNGCFRNSFIYFYFHLFIYYFFLGGGMLLYLHVSSIDCSTCTFFMFYILAIRNNIYNFIYDNYLTQYINYINISVGNFYILFGLYIWIISCSLHTIHLFHVYLSFAVSNISLIYFKIRTISVSFGSYYYYFRRTVKKKLLQIASLFH